MSDPSLRLERLLIRQGATLVCGMDEVGRGALGGPVSVGAVVIDGRTRALPGVRDSKALSADVRESLVPRIQAWAVSCSVGHASAAEIDANGLVAALRLAGRRALAGLAVAPDAVILDGRHDWLSEAGQLSLLGSNEEVLLPPVTMRVKADVTCTSVAAASVLAKVERDAILTAMSHEFPGYGWASNKAYASEEHRQALVRLGPSAEHRRTWRLGVGDADEGAP